MSKNKFSRRHLLKQGISFSAYSSVANLFDGRLLAQGTPSFPPRKKLVWIQMSGGWDLLETVNPKIASTSGIDMSYNWSQAHNVGNSGEKIGRWLPNLASHGSDMVVVRGLNMGTTSHMAGRVYMDTGVLSNSGTVNAASIPAIVASEASATIPIIQLSGGSEPQTDRGLFNPVSVVRASNLELYRSMYPQDANELAVKNKLIEYLSRSISKRGNAALTADDRLADINTAMDKIGVQFTDNVGSSLTLSDADRALFENPAITELRDREVESFALAYKLLRNDVCSCINIGIGGFDTHANQTRMLEPILNRFDHLLSTFIAQLKASNMLDDVLIVVYSDFGRTPKVNARNGRDHWPVGGSMLIGGGLDGGRFVGDTDNNMLGVTVDPNNGLASNTNSAIQLNPTHLGGSIIETVLGSEYLTYRTYLQSVAAMTRQKG